jgi:ABC-type dipeptide/oligopeptide/nickel transport system permease subunit
VSGNAISVRPSRPQSKSSSISRSAWVQPLAVAGVILVGAWGLVAVFAQLISPSDPLAVSGSVFAPLSPHHLLGTDELGRDVLSRVLWGARLSLPLAVVMVVGIVVIGGTLGAIAGYMGGVIDGAIMRLADLVFAFPVILLAMAVTAALGPGLKNAVIAVILVAWPSYARLVRGLVRSLGAADYVSAARLLGASTRQTLLTDIVPNIAGPVIVLATLDVGRMVLLLSALSFLGLGAQPPTPEWGSMVADGTQYFDRWWLGMFPGLAIFSIVLGFSFLGDSLRDALDPKTSWSIAGTEE